MTEALPDRMDYEIEETDIVQDGNTILDSMSMIREEFLKGDYEVQVENGIISKTYLESRTKAEEYLHLTYRLASIIEGIDGTETHFQQVNECAQKNLKMMSYDYGQASFWKNQIPGLDKSLDKLLIRIRRENLSTMKEKHHIMQAAKYLISKGENKEKRKEIFNNILPVVLKPLNTPKLFTIGDLKKLNLKEGLEKKTTLMKMDGTINLEKSIEVAQFYGFRNLLTTINRNDRLKFKEKYDLKVIEVEPQEEFFLKRKLAKLKKGQHIAVEIKINRYEEANEQEIDLDKVKYFDKLTNLAKKTLEDSIEKNLIWSEKNHHSFGAQFGFEILKEDSIKNCEYLIDEKTETFSYFHTKEFNGYKNLALLCCKPFGRYVLSCISDKKFNEKEIIQIISGEQSTEGKLLKLGKEYNSEFVRLTKYVKTNLKDDYEAFQ